MNAQSGGVSEDVAKTIIEKIQTHAEVEGPITLDTPLADLGIHSLELTEIIFDVEDAFGIEVEMNTAEAWENLHSVRDLVTAVQALNDAKS